MRDPVIIKLVHMHCDGELSPEQTAALHKHLETHPQDREAVEAHLETHRKLRDRVSQVMASQCPCCPQQVRSRIDSILASGAVDEAQSGSVGKASGNPSRLKFSRWFAGPQRANVFAIAATLALVAGVVLYSIFSPNIDQLPRTRSADLLATAAAYADQEHRRCANNSEVAAADTPISGPKDAEQDLTGYIGQPVRVFDLRDAGYEFMGAGHCDMGLPEKSAHLLYKSTNPVGDKVPMASVFVLPRKGGCTGMCGNNALGQWYEIKGTNCRKKVVQSTDGKIIYIVVCCKDLDLPNVTGHMTIASNISGR